jgi:anti-sigma B factor antagonist
MELKVINSDASYTHLVLEGKLDIAGVGEVENKFISTINANKGNAIVDLSGVAFLGSMGLRIFLSAAKALNQTKKKLILLSPQPMVELVLDASGIADVVIVEHDLAAALARAKA